jgi:hypothetical protein
MANIRLKPFDPEVVVVPKLEYHLGYNRLKACILEVLEEHHVGITTQVERLLQQYDK